LIIVNPLAYVLFQLMDAFLYRCPITGMRVQGWSAEEVAPADTREDTYVITQCLACRQVHLVATGHVAGAEDAD
jgi:hypothetical protein